MSEKTSPAHKPFPEHGSDKLPSLRVDSYNTELRDGDGFVGDRASRRAFRSIIDDWRDRLRRVDGDPIGKTPTKELTKKEMDKLLKSKDPEIAGIMHSVIEEFAQELSTVIRRLLRLQAWHNTSRIVVGGGLRASRVGEVAIGRAMVGLKAEGLHIDLIPIRHHPDEAGLIGAVQLVPGWILDGYDALLAVDIGGTNIRTGVVEFRKEKKRDMSAARVWKNDLWCHADERPNRKQTIERLVEMLAKLNHAAAKERIKMAPMIGIACPGLIRKDGSISRGAQNLPGNWESRSFNLPKAIQEQIPQISGHDTVVLMHNDAVVQGLSEAPSMRDVKHWGVLTIGTGLGNARFTNVTEDRQ